MSIIVLLNDRRSGEEAPMIRLALISANETFSREMAIRVRRVRLQTFDNNSSVADCDAALFLGASANLLEVQRFLHAGKPVLLDAEACCSIEVVQLLSAVAQKTGVQFAVYNPERYLPSRQLIRQQLDAGKLGEPGLIRVHRWQTVSEQRDPHGLAVSLLSDLDLVLWLFGKSPTLVYALEQAEEDPSTCPDVLVHLGFPGGGMALLDNTHRMPPFGGYQSLSLIGSAGAAYVDDHENLLLLFRRSGTITYRTEEGFLHYAAAVQDFVDALKEVSDLAPQVTAWRKVLTLSAAVRQSIQNRRAIQPEGMH
jgi:predicted dehydrogenase